MSTQHGHGGGESPAQRMMVSMVGAGADEHDVDPPGANPLSLQAGHEPDAFGVRAILYVPALVVATLVVSYVFITGIFSMAVNTKTGFAAEGATSNAQVKAVNELPINERFGRISSTVPEAVLKQEDSKVRQPRLEYLKQQGDPQDPNFVRSKRPLQVQNNPPEIRPEFLRPQNYVDPASGTKILLAAEKVPSKDADAARIPIQSAIELATAKGGKLALPVRKDPVKLPDTSDVAAKFSNGGKPGEGDKPHAGHDDHKHDKDHKDEKPKGEKK